MRSSIGTAGSPSTCPFSTAPGTPASPATSGRPACNDFSIGIELEGADTTPYERAQYGALSRVVRALMDRWPAIRPDRIVGHSDVAPGRKTDPGPAFDWPGFRRLLVRA